PAEDSSAPLQVDSPIVAAPQANIEKLPTGYAPQIADSVFKEFLSVGHFHTKSIADASIALDAENPEWTVVDRKKKGN
ncbi:hypothetical protein KI387_023194, partial [Taxus chinensis]